MSRISRGVCASDNPTKAETPFGASAGRAGADEAKRRENMEIKNSQLVESFESELENCARGIYQKNLLAGNEAWSGARLRGTARRYGGHYARSREALIGRLNKVAKVHGVKISTELLLNENKRQERVLVAEVIS